MKDVRTTRDDLVAFVRRDLVGPTHGAEEVLGERPSLRYSAGVLFPAAVRIDESSESGGKGIDESEPEANGEDAEVLEGGGPVPIVVEGTGPDTTAHDEVVTLANSFKPSAMALSFSCERPETALRVSVSAARYERGEATDGDAVDAEEGSKDKRRSKRHMYARNPLDIAAQDFAIGAGAASQDRELAPGLRLMVVARPQEGGRFLCTVSLYNSTRVTDKEAVEFFQAGFEVTDADGHEIFHEYRPPKAGARDAEEISLAMLYRSRRVFALGHGCAADWTEGEGGVASAIRTETIPVVRVPPVLPTAGEFPWLSMQVLSGEGGAELDTVPDVLEQGLLSEYRSWIDALREKAESVGPEFEETARDHLAKCEQALRRMEHGVRVLRRNDHALRAFALVNAAMLRQQYHSRRRRTLDDPWVPFPDEYVSNWEKRRGYWRKFQLAFVLMTLPSFVPDEHVLELDEEEVDLRNLVDLIWFPTGGGKTEAYLGLAAFAIFMRRLTEPSDSGCTVLMRYTLRLLTAQQFQRAASLICALELIRREDPERFGSDEISIGLFVGKSLTPNKEADARRAVNRLAGGAQDAKNPFQLLTCPWCGTELDNAGNLGYVVVGKRQLFRCPANSSRTGEKGSCPFSANASPLPVCVVDESVYATPPTLLIGTVDKFAMLAWRPEASSLFGYPNASPPALIIQDELHLISGPLGSMVGLYEGVFDLLCQRKTEQSPKIVASTATIRRAGEQCRALFDRGMFQFPPAGLDASDSYFAEEKSEEAGRVYLGLLPTAASSPLTAHIRAFAALAQGIVLVTRDDPANELIDPYWTVVQYFGSLKELGRAATLVTGDIPEYLPSMHDRYGIDPDFRRWLNRHEELTGRKDESEIPKILKDLERRYTKDAKPEAAALDTLLATNMISVGVDVERLGLMMVVTQPKSTSEYIQASSRVGRSSAAPGLVLTLYNAGRPRDRSHYEQFRSYHDAYYRYVEPTSVTPFALSALERALHAVLVIIARHIARAEKPGDFDPTSPKAEAALAFLRARAESVDPDHLEFFDRVLEERLGEWQSWNPEQWGGFTDSEETTLMYPAGNPPDLLLDQMWAVPTSMRNVDVECDVRPVNLSVAQEEN